MIAEILLVVIIVIITILIGARKPPEFKHINMGRKRK